MTLEASLKQSDSRSSAFRADIEGLRGVAILLVVLFHCDVSAFSGGFVGVDIFFVLSGFLITGILVREVQTTAQLNLLEFYARRARRLLPAFAITVITTLLVGVLILTPDELDLTARAARAAALHLGNMFFDMNSGDYFSPSVQSNPLLHTWSLAVEEQFYLFWPLLILIGSRWRQSTHALVPLLLGLTLISLGVGIALGGNTFAFYELPARAWEFGIGGLTWFLSQKKLQGVSQWGLTIGWCGFLAILSTTSLLSVTSAASFPGWIALIPTLGTAAILIAGQTTEFATKVSLLASLTLVCVVRSIAKAIDLDGCKHVLGLWLGNQPYFVAGGVLLGVALALFMLFRRLDPMRAEPETLRTGRDQAAPRTEDVAPMHSPQEPPRVD